jgi:hypothetical protein
MCRMQFTEEQLLIRDMAKSFAQEQIKPNASDWDRDGTRSQSLALGLICSWAKLFAISRMSNCSSVNCIINACFRAMGRFRHG